MRKQIIYIVFAFASINYLNCMQPDDTLDAPLAGCITASPTYTSHKGGKYGHSYTSKHGKYKDPYLALDWSPDGSELAAGWAGPQGIIVFKKQGEMWIERAREYSEHSPAITAVAWNPDGTQLVSGNGNGVILWNSSPLEFIDRFSDWLPWSWDGSGYSVDSIAWSSNGKLLAFTGENTVRIWSPDNEDNKQWWSQFKRLALSYPAYDYIIKFAENVRPTSIAWDATNTKLAIALLNGPVYIWDKETQQQTKISSTDDLKGTSVSWSSNGLQLASGCNDGTVRIWDTKTWKLLQILNAQKAIKSLKWSHGSSKLAATAGDDLLIWDAVKYELFKRLQIKSKDNTPSKNQMIALAWKPFDTHIAASNASGVIHIWKLSESENEDN